MRDAIIGHPGGVIGRNIGPAIARRLVPVISRPINRALSHRNDGAREPLPEITAAGPSAGRDW
jgi:hypothetical protein